MKKINYILLYKLRELKRKLGIKESILELFNLQELDLSHNQLTNIARVKKCKNYDVTS